ncbi:MAG: nucleoside triphosphate pyrophosphohydrolase family protein [Chromatiaceae bacterium]|nr:nucleoside triphosphate pyrophosphohydrolase family protein [Candidatus Thioaporhodococcus sediminis]
MTLFDAVSTMHQHFGLEPVDDPPPHDFALFRSSAMAEEVVEFQRAVLKDDRVGQLDALVDLVVFALGTAHLLGFSESAYTEAFHRVMLANLEKQVAGHADHKRGWKLDLVKPAGWTSPNLSDLV